MLRIHTSVKSITDDLLETKLNKTIWQVIFETFAITFNVTLCLNIIV